MQRIILMWNMYNQLIEAMDESDEDSSDDEEIILLTEERGDAPLRISNYVERIIPNLTNVQFKSHFRMSIEAFEVLIQRVGPELRNNHPEGRPTIDIQKQLLAVIWILGTPDSYRSVAERFNESKGSLFESFKRVISVLCGLAPAFIKWPVGEYALSVKAGFAHRGFNECIGVIDGSYIQIKAPKENPESYICRKKFYAITLQGVCDNTLKFTDCFCGYPSSVNDIRIFRNSDLYKGICNDVLRYFPNDEHIIGDKAYPVKRWCITPFINRGNLTNVETHFNLKLSQLRQIIERCFALLKGRYRRLKYLDMSRTDLIPSTVLACCVLHNHCIERGDIQDVDDYIREGREIIEDNFLRLDEPFEEEAGVFRRDALALTFYRNR